MCFFFMFGVLNTKNLTFDTADVNALRKLLEK